MVYVRYNENRERSAARNSGIKIARGKYIAFLDHDDEWLNYKLEKQVEFMENSKENIGVVYTGYIQIWDNLNGKKIKNPFMASVKKLEGNIHEELKRADFILPSSALVKRDIFEKIGLFDEKLAGPEAWDLWLRVSKNFLFEFLEEPLVIRHIHDRNLSGIYFNPIELSKQMYYIGSKYNDLNLNTEVFKWFLENYNNIEDFLEYLRTRKNRLVIFGASARGIAIFKYLISKGIKCDFFVDNDKEKWGKKIESIKIKSPDSLGKNDIVIIGSGWWREIVEQLYKLAITNKIVVG